MFNPFDIDSISVKMMLKVTLILSGTILASGMAVQVWSKVRSDEPGPTTKTGPKVLKAAYDHQEPALSLEPETSCLIIDKERAEANAESITVSGELRNGCGHDFASVTLTYKVFNEDDVVLGNAVAALVGLDDGETWAFRASAEVPGSRYVLQGVTGK